MSITNDQLLEKLLQERRPRRGFLKAAGATLLVLGGIWAYGAIDIQPMPDTTTNQPAQTSVAVVRPTAVIAAQPAQGQRVVVPVAPAVDTRPAPQATAETLVSQASSEAQDLQQRVDAQNAENAAHANESMEQNTLDSLVQMQAVEQATAHALAEQTKHEAEAKADAQAAAVAATATAEYEASQASEEQNMLNVLLQPTPAN